MTDQINKFSKNESTKLTNSRRNFSKGDSNPQRGIRSPPPLVVRNLPAVNFFEEVGE